MEEAEVEEDQAASAPPPEKETEDDPPDSLRLAVIVIDTEGGGLHPWQTGMTALCARLMHWDEGFTEADTKEPEWTSVVKCSKGVVMTRSAPDAFYSMCRTQIHICAEASAVTGITAETLVEAPKPADVVDAFAKWLASVRTLIADDIPMILLAHNGMWYDFPLVWAHMVRTAHPMALSPVSWLMDTLPWARHHLADTARLKLTKRGNPSYALGSIHEAVTGSSIEGAHDAFNDVMALCRVVAHDSFRGMWETAVQHIRQGQSTAWITTKHHWIKTTTDARQKLIDSLAKERKGKGTKPASTPPAVVRPFSLMELIEEKPKRRRT
jgi:DNA polymerase III epsilon subunit-like protein